MSPRNNNATNGIKMTFDLTKIRPLLYAMALEHVDNRSLWDDVVQEAMIHVWRLVERDPNHSAAYFHKCARTRIQEVSKRQTWLGHTGTRGVPIDPLRRSHHSLDRLVDDGFFSWEDEDSTLALRCTVAQ